MIEAISIELLSAALRHVFANKQPALGQISVCFWVGPDCVRVKASYTDSTLITYNVCAMALLLIIILVQRRMFKDVHSIRLARITRVAEANAAKNRRIERSRSKSFIG